LVPFDQQTWPPRLILFFWLANVKKIISSETAWTNGAKHGRKHLCKVSKPGIDGTWVCPFQNCVWQPHPPFKMAAVFKVMIISLWNLLQYHSIVRWAIQAQWAEPLVCIRSFDHMTCLNLRILIHHWTYIILIIRNHCHWVISSAVEPIVFLHQTRFIMKGPRLFRPYFKYNTCHWFLENYFLWSKK
jgi:hypothetical protein